MTWNLSPDNNNEKITNLAYSFLLEFICLLVFSMVLESRMKTILVFNNSVLYLTKIMHGSRRILNHDLFIACLRGKRKAPCAMIALACLYN